ncbi:hypothetical protein ACIGG6_03590 [Vreelandella lionensis]|uniref:Uncharacterized protein n=1 Tax=Vreelandella lionensis TaxID=1144478 RepID=A0ABW8BPH0_9GAMM
MARQEHSLAVPVGQAQGENGNLQAALEEGEALGTMVGLEVEVVLVLNCLPLPVGAAMAWIIQDHLL